MLVGRADRSVAPARSKKLLRLELKVFILLFQILLFHFSLDHCPRHPNKNPQSVIACK